MTEQKLNEATITALRDAVDNLHPQVRAARPWTIEAHGDGEALYYDRGPQSHGLNIVHLTEPAYQWSSVRTLLPLLLQHADGLVARAQGFHAIERAAHSETKRAVQGERDRIVGYLRRVGAHDFDGANGYLEAARDLEKDRDRTTDDGDGANPEKIVAAMRDRETEILDALERLLYAGLDTEKAKFRARKKAAAVLRKHGRIV